ncbi:MAG: cobyrinate a,c-diamide synthase [bacterium]
MDNKNLLGIAGTRSGSGKTLITLGFIRALRKKGLTVQPFKVGPDFIDPLYHEDVADRPSVNLDQFCMDDGVLNRTVDNYIGSADVGIIEGVMGLYDGKSGQPGLYSTAELYRSLEVPYVLVVNAAGQSHSIAATIEGFINHDDRLDCAGVVLTQVSSDRHEEMLCQSIEDSLSTPVLGSIRSRDSLSLPSRHLGLDTAFLFDDSECLSGTVDDEITADLTLPGFLPDVSEENGSLESVFKTERQPEVTIGVAWDDAFHFYYDCNLRLLKDAGAELVQVSPLADRTLPERLDGLYLGGGYPEQFADRLASNRCFLEDLKRRLREGLPAMAECGGFMYLSREITDRSGDTYSMAGWFDATIRQRSTFQSLGYISGSTTESHPFLESGLLLKGHEFHYSNCVIQGDFTPAIDLREGDGLGDGSSGIVRDNTIGSYGHWHFAATPELANQFVDVCSTRRVSRV